MSELHEKLQTALKLWLKLTGYKQKGKSIRDWEARMTVEELQESLELDDTGVTTAMVLRALLEQAKQHTTFSLREIYEREADFMKTIRLTHKLHKQLALPEIAEAVTDFDETLKTAIAHYDGKPAAYEHAADRAWIGMLRRDVLRSVQRFKRYQFVRAPSRTPKAGYNKWVLSFMNINSLVEAVAQQPEYGVSLCMIRDNYDELFNYFVFACWNGGTLTLLTDKPSFSHPGQKRMTRRPDRALEKRWGEHHFPYELLELEGEKAGTHVPGKPGLVHYDTQACRLKQLNELEPDVFLWTIMVFGKIEEEHFARNLQLPEQSYTSEMVQTGNQAGTALMRLDGFQPVVLPQLHKVDITTEKLIDQWESEPTRENAAFERDFAPQVPDELLNLLQNDRGQLLLGEMSPAAKKLIKKLEIRDRWTDEVEDTQLMPMVPTEFGTPAELRAAQIWSARYNQAVAINLLVETDFKKNHVKVMKWFCKAVRENAEFLLEAAARMDLTVDTFRPRGYKEEETFTKHTVDDLLIPTQRNLLQHIGHHDGGSFGFKYIRYLDRDTPMAMLHAGYNQRHKYRHGCYDNGKLATLYFEFIANIPHEISILTGVPVTDLPVQLRDYYSTYEPYGGNCILDKLDPMDWVVKNPWRKLPIGVGVYLSKSAFQARRKALGLDPVKPAELDKYRDKEFDKKHPNYTPRSRF